MSYLDRKGEKFITNQGYEIEIIEFYNAKNCTIKFTNSDYIVKNKTYGNIKKGSVANPFHINAHGVGFIGQGFFKCEIESKSTKEYPIWNSMISRCYNIKNTHFTNYKDVTVCEEWLNFQNFAKWYSENFNPKTMRNWHLDKDILVKGNKIYSPETCCFVPSEINNLFTKRGKNRGILPIGVSKNYYKYRSYILKNSTQYNLGNFFTPEEAFEAYKIAKEQHIKEIADKWRDKIGIKVYKAMYNYKVEIND